MEVTVAGLFLDRQSAEEATESLIDAGYDRESISIVAGEHPDLQALQHEIEETEIHPPGEETLADAVTGGVLGGILGLSASVVLPGSLVVIGPLAGLIGGTALGLTAGAVVGAIRDLGIDEHDAHGYLTSIEAGAVLVAVHVDEPASHRAAELLSRAGTHDVHIVHPE